MTPVDRGRVRILPNAAELARAAAGEVVARVAMLSRVPVPGKGPPAVAHKEPLGSAEDNSDAMCLPVIDEPDAEIAVEGDAIDLH